jgi:SAM-dependent methyltransferase
LNTHAGPGYWDSLGVIYWHIGAPLRPSKEDTQIMEGAVRQWAPQVEGRSQRALLLGVTPAIAEMQWPRNTFLTAIDNAFGMAKVLWPGNVPGERGVAVADWLSLPLRNASCQIVVGDNSLSCVRYPDSLYRLLADVARVLDEDGVLVLRCLLQPEEPECPNHLLANMFEEPDTNFTQFRVRLMMALQQDSRRGIATSEVYRLWSIQNFDLDEVVERTGWKKKEIDFLEFWRQNDAVYTFLTLEEMRSILEECFEEVEILTPSYTLGARCPTLVLRRRS